MVLGRAALVVAAVREPRGNVDHLAGFTLMLTVSEPDRRAAFKNYKEQVNIVGMQRRVPAVAEKAGQHGRALGARHEDSLVVRVAGIGGVGHRYPSYVRHLIGAPHTCRSTGCAESTQACRTGPTPVTTMTAGSSASAFAPS